MSTARLHQARSLLMQAHDALDGLSDSEINHFEDEDDEREMAPEQYAARKIMEAAQLIESITSEAP